MNISLLCWQILFFLSIINFSRVTCKKKSRHGKVVRPRRKIVPRRSQVPAFGNRRSMGPIEDETDITDCEISMTKNSPVAVNSKDVLLGSKGAVAALGAGENKTLICMLKAFDLMKGRNGVILRKTKTGLTMITNDEVNLDDMLNGKIASQALHIGVSGQTSLRKGSKEDESTAALDAKDDNAGASFNSKTRNKDGGMETYGIASGSLDMSRKGRKRLQVNSEEETSFDSNKKPHSQNGELGTMKHTKKTGFDLDI